MIISSFRIVTGNEFRKLLGLARVRFVFSQDKNTEKIETRSFKKNVVNDYTYLYGS